MKICYLPIKETLCFFAILSFLLSCSPVNTINDKQGNNGIPADTAPRINYTVNFAKGAVLPRVACSELCKKPFDKASDSVTYALYLPKNYSPDKQYPVIFLFDSHGSGSFPIQLYKELAEKYGYILAGSNDSQNGIPWEQNRESIKIFMRDVYAKFSINPKRIYTCGFSGGSRVASAIAIFEGGINCVIGMGAGFPNLSDPIRNRFDYIGFAGNEDFNMNEMMALNASMDKTPIRHQLIIFKGKHEWAPAPVAEEAFFWLELNAMRSILIPPNDSFIKMFIEKNLNEIKEFEKNKKVYDELQSYKKIINYIDVMADLTEYKKKEAELRSSQAFIKDSSEKASLEKEEAVLQKKYKDNFALKDLTWWKEEVRSLNAKAKSKDEAHAVMFRRLLNYLSLVAYMNASSALQSRQEVYADTFLKIYELVDPPNPEHQYLFAELYASKKENEKAMASLKNALKLGFKDVSRMEADTSFVALRSNPGYQKLMASIQPTQ